jgi:hypothetical protein
VLGVRTLSLIYASLVIGMAAAEIPPALQSAFIADRYQDEIEV